MIARRLALGLLVALAAGAHAQPAVEAPLARALAGVVRADGRFDTARLARQADDLDAALAAVAATDPAALRSDAQKTAFLVNAYHARLLRTLVDHPRARHLERDGLFDAFFRTRFVVAGQRLTLNEVEHGLLRRQARVDGRALPAGAIPLRVSRVDFRIHAVVNCGAASCPRLPSAPLTSATLEPTLAAAWRAMAASDRHVRMEGRRLVLSSLFDWYAADVEAGGAALGDRLLGAMSPARAAAFRTRLAGRTAADLRRDRSVRFDYDWSVNR